MALTALVGAGALVAVIEDNPSERGGTTGTPASSPEAPASDTVGPSTDEAGRGTPRSKGGSGSDTAMAQAGPAGPAGAGGAGGVVPPGGPRVVRTASLRVEVAHGGFGGAFDKAQALATANGGFVASSSTATGGRTSVEPTSAEEGAKVRPQAGELVLRVPADRFDTVRRALAELGTVGGESVQGDDVTAQLVDYEARLKSLSAEEDALRTLLGRATAVGEVLGVQGRLFEVRQQVEQLQAQRDQLDRAATFATVSVSMFEPGAVTGPPAEPVDGLARSLRQAVRGSVSVVGGMIVVVGWLTPIALFALAGWGVVRLGRRLRRRPSPVATPEPAA